MPMHGAEQEWADGQWHKCYAFTNTIKKTIIHELSNIILIGNTSFTLYLSTKKNSHNQPHVLAWLYVLMMKVKEKIALAVHT